MAVSNIGMQVFEQNIGTQFRETFQDKALYTKHFDFIPPSAFLCSLIHPPLRTPGLGLKISAQDLQVFQGLSRVPADIVVKAIKAFKSQSDQGKDVDDDL